MRSWLCPDRPKYWWRARVAEPGVAVRYAAPPAPGRSAEVGVHGGNDSGGSSGVVAVYLDPADSRVLGTLHDDAKLSQVLRSLHTLAIAGPLANLWVEVVAVWAIVLVASGMVLWWPRERSDGVVSVRGSLQRRVWWRHLRAVAGAGAAAAILFLAVTGMPWSAFWEEQFGGVVGAATSAVAVAVLLGLIYPLLDASMLVALVADAAVSQVWHQRLSL